MTRFERHPVVTLIAILVVLLVAFLATAEWLLRPADGRTVLIGHESSPRPDRFLKLREWQPDSRFTFGPAETRVQNATDEIPEVYVLETDGAGFIEPSVVHPDPDAEIIFVGGSTTECLYVMPENRFPYVAGRLLEDRLGLKVNGINAGKSGNSTMLSLLATVGKVLPRRPDFVVLMHATNDIGVLNRYGSYWNESSDHALVGRREQSLERLFRDFRDATVPYSYRGLRRGLKALSSAGPLVGSAAAAVDATTAAAAPETGDDKRARMGADFESALRSLVAVVRAWHSEPVLMTQVVVRAKPEARAAEGAYLSRDALAAGRFTPESFSSTHAYFNAIIRQVALSEGVPLIDLAAARDWSDVDVYDGLHFTDPGSRNVAEVVAAALAPLLEARSAQP